MSKSKRKSNKFVTVVVIVLVTVVLSMAGTIALYNATNAFEIGVQDLIYNQDNLIRSIEEYEGLSGNNGNGLVYTVNGDKSFKVKGSITSGDASVEWVLGEVTIDETGVYTLSGLNGASLATAYLEGTYTDVDGNVKTIYGDIAGTCSAELVEGTNVSIKLVIFEGAELNTTVHPTFTLGEKAGRF